MSAPPNLKLQSLADLYSTNTEEREQDVVENMFVSGAASLVVAKPKVGKTTLAEVVAYGVATGTSVLGRETKQGPVIYLQMEASAVEVADHFRRMGATGGEPIHIHMGPVAGDKDTTALAVEGAIRELKPALVLIDSVQRLFRFKDINDYSEVTKGFEMYTEMARVYGPHICFLHHMGKEDRATNVSDAILGSTALLASVDLGLIMLKNADTRTMQTDGPQRFGINIPPTVLSYDPETGLVSAGEELATARRNDIRQKILDALSDFRLPMGEIKKAVGGDSARVHSEVISLHADGFVERAGTGKAGDPYLFWVRKPPEDTKPNGHSYADEVRRDAEEYRREQAANPLFKGMPH